MALVILGRRASSGRPLLTSIAAELPIVVFGPAPLVLTGSGPVVTTAETTEPSLPTAAASFDFTSAVYTIGVTSYAVGDLFETPSVDIGNTYQPGDISASGWLVDNDNDGGPRVKGDLATLLNSAHTALIEWTDTSTNSTLNDVFVYSDKPALVRQQRCFACDAGAKIHLRALTPANAYLGEATCDNLFQSAFDTDGLNRVAATIGSASSMLSMNGATPDGTIDHSTMFPNTFDDIQPLGSYMGDQGSTLYGYVRKLEIYAVQTDPAVLALMSAL